MNSLTIIEIIMILYAFSVSFLIGMMVLGYVIWRRDRERKIQNQLDACLKEDSQPLDSFKAPMADIDHFVVYEDCVIEKRGGKFYIIKPSGKYLKKEFNTVEDAKEEVDIVTPLLPKRPDSRQTIQNIRFVK